MSKRSSKTNKNSIKLSLTKYSRSLLQKVGKFHVKPHQTKLVELSDESLNDIGLERENIEQVERGQHASDEMSSMWLITSGSGRVSLKK